MRRTPSTIEVMTTMLTEGHLDRERPLDVAPLAPQRWYRTAMTSRELRPDYCPHGHPANFLQGWEPGRGRYYACQIRGCTSVQHRS